MDLLEKNSGSSHKVGMQSRVSPVKPTIRCDLQSDVQSEKNMTSHILSSIDARVTIRWEIHGQERMLAQKAGRDRLGDLQGSYSFRYLEPMSWSPGLGRRSPGIHERLVSTAQDCISDTRFKNEITNKGWVISDSTDGFSSRAIQVGRWTKKWRQCCWS